jgi:predicted DNA-binding protein (MmcQ/YjbR family)
MTRDEYNRFCGSLEATTHVVQWGGSHVWKVGDKVFAIAGFERGEDPHITFKVSDIGYEVLKDQPGLRPAPYLASRGMKWIQHYAKPGLSKRDLKQYLMTSHRIVAQGLSKKKQKALGLVFDRDGVPGGSVDSRHKLR